MCVLIPIQYNNRKYPLHISPKLNEIPGHFDVTQIKIDKPFSLHTEYSYTSRKFSSPFLENCNSIKSSHINYVPELWKDENWAQEFAVFITHLTEKSNNLKIIEIHPPFNNYCPSFSKFINVYKLFEKSILKKFNDIDLLIENRYGTTYNNGKFLFSALDDFDELIEEIDKKNLNIRIVVDFPQLLAKSFAKKEINCSGLEAFFNVLKNYKSYIKGIHLWGKKKTDSGNIAAHCGDLNDLFDNNTRLKSLFLENLLACFDDSIERYFVPEVNSSSKDLLSIIEDLLQIGFKFT